MGVPTNVDPGAGVDGISTAAVALVVAGTWSAACGAETAGACDKVVETLASGNAVAASAADKLWAVVPGPACDQQHKAV